MKVRDCTYQNQKNISKTRREQQHSEEKKMEGHTKMRMPHKLGKRMSLPHKLGGIVS